ncbi:helix-turn-helix domain-containing protein [Methylobacterium guangdongense]|uniref:helix-turn-helix domain-containing protein n=1 Tax=Methylobacterium guangdongense TaxID=3138811 RepID=UPI00399CED2C
MGGCTECFTVWWGCRCPLRCEECGCGYRADGASTCGTPGCAAGQRRVNAILAEWERRREAERATAIQCAALQPAEPETTSQSVPPSDPEAPGAQRGSQNAPPSPADEGGAVTTPPASRPRARRQPAAKVHADRRTPQPSKPAHRPVAERRAAVEALLAEGLSDREIARRAGVSPSTVSAVRKGQESAKFGA